ncbi:hypothetical protein F4803DRAFT_556923 [Xylaria telfairii]|nr:hypothetical protein F4803DRAFT_556923 [Xylaria telfairii]
MSGQVPIGNTGSRSTIGNDRNNALEQDGLQANAGAAERGMLQDNLVLANLEKYGERIKIAVISLGLLILHFSSRPLSSSQLHTSTSADVSEVDPPEPTTIGSSPATGEKSEHLDVSRTVIVERGSALNNEKKYIGLTEEKYDSIVAGFSGESPFGMVKHVRTTPADAKGSLLLGNPALDNAIVDRVESETIEITSPHLLKIIKENVYWPSAAFYDGQKRLTFNSPYRAIGAYRDRLGEVLKQRQCQLATRDPDKTTNEIENVGKLELSPIGSKLADKDLELTVRHLELFLREVDKGQSEMIKLEDERYSRQMATFDMLWKLLKPGMPVYVEEEGKRLACRVRLLVWSHGVINAGPGEPYQDVKIFLWYLDHDGRYINRRSHSVTIERFHGEKSILQLPVYPEQFLENWEDLRSQRVQRGRKYIELIKNGYSHRNYKGDISINDKNPYNKQNHLVYYGHVLVDPEQHYREHGRGKDSQWLDEADVHENTLGIDIKGFIKLDPTQKPRSTLEGISSVFGENQLFLLPEWIRGFTISTQGERKWDEPDRELAQTIALEERQIKLLKAMTYDPTDFQTDTGNEDHIWSPERIEGKGKGRVIILHGVPGVGKTYTVECIAEWSGRPLLRLSCAELGLDPVGLELRLQTYLRRAERWKAIVLMDEADVYMSERVSHNPGSQTALVSIFLRALEYYAGIIFLITNRVDIIDKAIINRALLIMAYQPLNSRQIDTIAENCLESYRKVGRKINGGAASLFRSVVKNSDVAIPYDWDGREIVQVLTVAARLAAFDLFDSKYPTTPIVTEEHICEAVRIIQGHGIRDNENKKFPHPKSFGYEEHKFG